MTVVDYGSLSANKPHKPLLKRLPSNSGRNNHGRITVRHQGGGNKKLYRVVDFRQMKLNVPAKVETIEYDPYRSAFIVKIIYFSQYDKNRYSADLQKHFQRLTR